MRGSVGALGLATASAFTVSPKKDAIAAASHPIPDDKLGVALVGLGNYATNQIAPALQETEWCRLAGVVSGTPSKITDWQAKYAIPDANVYTYETFDRIADNDDIDVVYVVLPNSMHAEYTIRAAEAGKHVICEKPMAISVPEGEQMIEGCRSAGVKLSIGYRLHFEPMNQYAMQFGREKLFGDVKLIESSFGFRAGNPDQWRLKKALAGGGPLMDVGIYALQAARYVTGEEPTSVVAFEQKTDPIKFAEVEETLIWQLRFPSGAVASSSTSYATYVQRLYVAAQRGWLEMSPAYVYGGLRGRTHEGPLDYPEINQQAAQMDDFAQCVIEDRASAVAGEEGLQDMKVIEAIYRAAESGEEETI